MGLKSYDSYAGNVLFGTDGSLLLGPVEGGRVVLGVASQHNCGADLSVFNLWWALLKVHWGFWGEVKIIYSRCLKYITRRLHCHNLPSTFNSYSAEYIWLSSV